MIYTEYVSILKALGEETRIQIFEMLRNGSLCACKIQEKFNITQPTLSHHLKVLCDSGIVNAEKDGKWTYYSIDCNKLDSVMIFLCEAKCKREKIKCD